ncbi:MAG: ABC transporter substrate-binding protein [SAR324 cluster bacterium]|nr:ABC transporter substrate-binding protein [SAR324 cluster bacterium]
MTKLFRLTALLLMIIITATYCFAENGVLPRSVILVTHQPLSGPARQYSEIAKSAKAYFQYVNDQGGVHGRLIELKIIDDQLNPEIAKTAFNELTVKHEIFAVFSGIGSKTHQAVYPILKQNSIPSFFVGSDLPEWTQPVRANLFAFLPTADTEAKILGKFLSQKHTEEKIIIWYADKPVYQRSVKALSKELYGVSAELLPGKTGRLTAEWKLINESKPDLLVVLGNYSDVMGILSFPTQLSIPILTGHALADSRLPESLNQEVLERVRFLTAFPLIMETENAGLIFHQQILNEYAADLTTSRWTIYGQAVAELMVEVLKRSGRALSRQKAVYATESIQQWQGQLLPPITFNSRNHLALGSLRVSQIKSGNLQHLSDWIDGQ